MSQCAPLACAHLSQQFKPHQYRKFGSLLTIAVVEMVVMLLSMPDPIDLEGPSSLTKARIAFRKIACRQDLLLDYNKPRPTLCDYNREPSMRHVAAYPNSQNCGKISPKGIPKFPPDWLVHQTDFTPQRRMLEVRNSNDEKQHPRRKDIYNRSLGRGSFGRAYLSRQDEDDGDYDDSEIRAPYIINATESVVGMFPWAVYIKVKDKEPGETFCSGVIIDDRTILTKTDCIRGIPKEKIKLYTGRFDISKESEEGSDVHEVENACDSSIRARVKGLEVHKEEADLSVLMTKKPIKFNPTTNAICLTDFDTRHISENCFVVGWGQNGFLAGVSVFPNTLQILPVRPQFCPFEPHPALTCFKKDPYYSLDSYVCQGDEGGAVACRQGNKYVLAGIVQANLSETCQSNLQYTNRYIDVLAMRRTIYELKFLTRTRSCSNH